MNVWFISRGSISEPIGIEIFIRDFIFGTKVYIRIHNSYTLIFPVIIYIKLVLVFKTTLSNFP